MKLNKEFFFNWLLIMVGVSLPFPDYSLVSKFIIGLSIFWLFFYNPLEEKKRIIKSNLSRFLTISSLYLLLLIGTIYTSERINIISELILKLPFVILPLIIFSVSIKKELFWLIYKYFSYAVLVTSMSALLKAIFFRYYGLGNYFYYHEFSIFLNKHSTYYALFLVLSIIYFAVHWIDDNKNTSKIIHTCIYILFLLYMLYIISNRISFIALSIGILILAFWKLRTKTKLVYTVLVIGFTVFMFNTSHLKNRFFPSYLQAQKLNEFELRKAHWKSVIETIRHNNIFFGTGTEGNRDYLYDRYKKNNYKIAYIHKYNAHNQFLEFTLDYGLFGSLIFLFFLFYIFFIFIKNKDKLAITILIVFLIFMMTESILERQSGIIIFTLFISLLMNRRKEK